MYIYVYKKEKVLAFTDDNYIFFVLPATDQNDAVILDSYNSSC